MASLTKGSSAVSETLSSGLYIPTAAEGSGAFPPFDPSTFAPQLVWLALTFGLLYFMLARVVLPRIGEVIDERKERISRDLAEAERLRAETDAALKAYEQSLAEARGKAQTIAKDMREQNAAEAEVARLKSDEDNAKLLVEQERQIASRKASALASVNDIAVETAGAIVSSLIGKTVGADELRKAVLAKPGA